MIFGCCCFNRARLVVTLMICCLECHKLWHNLSIYVDSTTAVRVLSSLWCSWHIVQQSNCQFHQGIAGKASTLSACMRSSGPNGCHPTRYFFSECGIDHCMWDRAIYDRKADHGCPQDRIRNCWSRVEQACLHSHSWWLRNLLARWQEWLQQSFSRLKSFDAVTNPFMVTYRATQGRRS